MTQSPHRGAASPVIDRILAGSSPRPKSRTQQSSPQLGEERANAGNDRTPNTTHENYVDNSQGFEFSDYRTPKTPIITFDQFMESKINRDPKQPSGGPGERIFSRSVTSRMRTPTPHGDQIGSFRTTQSGTTAQSRCGAAQSAPLHSASGVYDTPKRGASGASQRSRPKESEYQVNVGTHVAVTGGPSGNFRGRSTKSSPPNMTDLDSPPTNSVSGAAEKRKSGRHIDFDLPASSASKKDGGSNSLIQRFDRAVTNELSSRQLSATPEGVTTLNETFNSPNRRTPVQPNLALSLRSTVSGAEIEHILYGDQDMMFHDAVDKLAQAEEACMFAGAVKAAEEAAARAPPELAEEAAAAGARTYRARLIESFHETVPAAANAKGCKPIEVIGYIGITRPCDKAV